MAFEMKCICPDEDFSNMVSTEYSFFTLAEAAAVASGYSPCCTRWRTDKEFRYHCANPCEVMDLWEQQLRRALAGGELASVSNRLTPGERLIPRDSLETWLAKRKGKGKGKKVVGDNTANHPDPVKGATRIAAQTESEALSAPIDHAWKKTAKMLGRKIANDNKRLSVEQIAGKVHSQMDRMNDTGDPGMTGRGGRVPSAETIRRHALTGIRGGGRPT